MPPYDFPSNPTNGMVYANFIYDSSITSWRNVNTDTGIGTLNAMGLKNVVPTSVNVGSGSATTNGNGLVTFSNASSVSLNGVFTSTYRNYRVLVTITSAGGSTSVDYRFRAAGTDWAGGSGYIFCGTEGATAGGSFGNRYSNGQSTFSFGYAYTTYGNETSMDIKSPSVSGVETAFLGQCMSQLSSGNYGHNMTGRSNGNTNALDGITVIGASYNISGTIQVFGYTN